MDFFPGGVGNQTGDAIVMHIHNIVARVKRLKEVSSFSPSFSPSSTPLPPSSVIIYSKLAYVSIEFSFVKSNVVDLTSRIGQDAIETGGV